MNRISARLMVIVSLGLLVGASQRAAGAEEEGRAGLAAALKSVKVTLGQGLAASASAGKPISAKFEVEDGKLQLSVYTQKDTSFFEVIVDYVTGKIAKTEAITGGDDLTQAQAQGSTMASAKASLKEAAEKALKGNPGYRAVSVFPVTRNGRAAADVTLLKGGDWKSVSEPLD